MSIQDFYATAKRYEFARDFQFRVRTLGPFTESDLLYVTTASLPGKEISNQPVPFMGLEFNIPNNFMLRIPFPLVASLQDYKKAVDLYKLYNGE